MHAFIWLTAAFGLLMTIATANAMAGDSLRVGTFNIRNCDADDGQDGWSHRRGLFVETVRKFDPDVLGLQEVLPRQQADLTADLADYDTVFTFRDDGKSKGEASSIFYRKSRFDLLDHGTFWLSQTPEKPGSMGWDAACTRVCTWAKLRDRENGQTLLAANTHFDHVGVLARANSAKLIAERLKKISDGGAVLLTGDFNAIETGPVYSQLLDAAKSQGLAFTDVFRAAHPKVGPEEASYHGFKDATHGLRIDWIFVTPQLATDSCEIDHTKSVAGRYPSDHYPVWATLHYAVK